MIDDLIKNAMRQQNKVAMTAYRAVKAKILNEKTKKGKKEENEKILFENSIRKEIKEREETNSFIKDQQNETLLENNKIIEILKQHLPKLFSSEEQEKLILKAIAETGAKTVKEIGKVMGKLSEYQGKMDMKAASTIVRSKLEEFTQK